MLKLPKLPVLSNVATGKAERCRRLRFGRAYTAYASFDIVDCILRRCRPPHTLSSLQPDPYARMPELSATPLIAPVGNGSLPCSSAMLELHSSGIVCLKKNHA
jgi:hypothetical protein